MFATVIAQPLFYFLSMSWERVVLMYGKNDHASWSGSNTCRLFMSGLQSYLMDAKIEIEEAKLDAAESLYEGNNTRMLREQMEDHGRECIRETLLNSRQRRCFRCDPKPARRRY